MSLRIPFTLVLLALTVSIQAAPLTVVGFNVESGDSSDHVISLQLEKSVGVDLWGLVDVWDESGWPDRLREGAQQGENSEFGSVLGQSGGDSRLLVLYRKSRLRQLGIEELAAAQTSDRRPAPLAVRFRLDDAEEFWLLTVDLSESEDRRLVQAKALAEWTSSVSRPVVAVGTFNFGVEKDASRTDQAMDILLSSGWRLTRPVEHVGTRCSGGDRMEDLVFLAGPQVAWSARTEVMYPQSNYCPDSGRTSNHRPVLANLETTGTAPLITGSMPERQIRPFFPEEMNVSHRDKPALANEPVTVPSSSVSGPAASAQPAASGDGREAASREAMLKRLEALEEEARELRKQLEALPD